MEFYVNNKQFYSMVNALLQHYQLLLSKDEITITKDVNGNRLSGPEIRLYNIDIINSYKSDGNWRMYIVHGTINQQKCIQEIIQDYVEFIIKYKCPYCGNTDLFKSECITECIIGGDGITKKVNLENARLIQNTNLICLGCGCVDVHSKFISY